MRELSLNVLDIAQNSIAAGASLTEILVKEDTKEKQDNTKAQDIIESMRNSINNNNGTLGSLIFNLLIKQII